MDCRAYMGGAKSEGMRCAGIYRYGKEEIECDRRWSCRNFTIRMKPKREIPKSEWQMCDQYEKAYKDETT